MIDTGRSAYQKGQKPGRSKTIRNASMGKSCTLGIPGICARDNARVVGCHLRLFGIAGGAQKPDDLFILDCCDCCHEILDSRDKWADAQVGFDDVLRALILTQQRRRAEGLIRLEGEK